MKTALAVQCALKSAALKQKQDFSCDKQAEKALGVWCGGGQGIKIHNTCLLHHQPACSLK
jgi:hypothetical protein